MAYTVLARKYRSQTFDDVIGQDPIAQTLKNAIKTGRVAHAYLFTGTRGVGKTTMARVLAKALNCLNVDEPTREPCCKCNSCVAVNLGEDIDVIEIDGATNNGVEQVRELRQNAIYRPARARFKIYIIDEVHMLSVPAFNALLKILEEPPDHVKFIFATTEPNKVIPTIQSRCQRFDFSNIGPAQIAQQLKFILKQEKIKYEEDLVLPLARMANGSMRDGLSLLDRLISTGIEPLSVSLLEKFLGQPNSEKIWNLIGQIGDSDAAGTLAAIEDLIGTGISEVQIIDSLIDYMRDLMVVKSTGSESELLILTGQQRKRAGELAEKFDVAALIYNIATLEKLRWTVKNSDTSRALLEASLLRFALSEHFLNVDELLSQLKPGSAAAVKKKVTGSTANKINSEPRSSNNQTQKTSHELRDIQSIKDNWDNILRLITTKLGPGTGSLLSSAVPARLEDDVLALEFGPSARIQKRMCESNGRIEQVQALLSEQFSRPVRLRFEISANEHTPVEPGTTQPKTGSQKRNELINDPAVKTVLLGLDATITGIEED
ncbi:MAG: DNA polymerase III subunit gamma/tau [Planctomycetota bacterium]|jgi:DNA polymerase-3 subunit gamma/tau